MRFLGSNESAARFSRAAMWRLGLFYVAVGHPGTWEGQVIMNEQGAPLPDLSGRWACRQGAFELRSYQPAEWPARAPNSSYAKLRGRWASARPC